MWTVTYRGFTIHGHFDRDQVTIISLERCINRIHKSRSAAERWIRRNYPKGAYNG